MKIVSSRFATFRVIFNQFVNVFCAMAKNDYRLVCQGILVRTVACLRWSSFCQVNQSWLLVSNEPCRHIRSIRISPPLSCRDIQVCFARLPGQEYHCQLNLRRLHHSQVAIVCCLVGVLLHMRQRHKICIWVVVDATVRASPSPQRWSKLHRSANWL